MRGGSSQKMAPGFGYHLLHDHFVHKILSAAMANRPSIAAAANRKRLLTQLIYHKSSHNIYIKFW